MDWKPPTNPIRLTDGSCRYVDLDKCIKYDGSEPATPPWKVHPDHSNAGLIPNRDLYRTPGGKWILHSYHDCLVADKYEEIDGKAAACWLVLNGFQVPATLIAVARHLEID